MHSEVGHQQDPELPAVLPGCPTWTTPVALRRPYVPICVHLVCPLCFNRIPFTEFSKRQRPNPVAFHVGNIVRELKELLSSTGITTLTLTHRVWRCLKESRCTPDDLQVAHWLSHLGAQMIQWNAPYEAELLHRRALCIGSCQLGFNHPQLSYALDWLGLAFFLQGNYTEALLVCFAERALVMETMGHRHKNVCGCLMNMALIYDAQGWSLRAWQMREEATQLMMEMGNV